MNIGMLWFDNSSAPTADKIAKAAEYYKTKYGKQPNLCFVNPQQPAASKPVIPVRTSRAVLMNHFWIGVEHEN